MSFEQTPAAIVILIATLGISLYTMFRNQELYYNWLLHPYSLVRENKWYQLVSSGFLHGDMAHLIFNMLTFYFFAFKLELIVGTFDFLLIYFLSMIIANIPSTIKHKDDFEYRAVGASGAISGVIFAMILWVPDSSIYLMFIPIGIPSPIFGLIYLGYCWYMARNSQDHINHDAHLWGALSGIILTIIFQPMIIEHFLGRVFG